MVNCASEYAEITWEPGNENNDEVIAFYVYYNTSFDEQDVFHEGAEVLRGTQNAKVGSRNATQRTLKTLFTFFKGRLI